MYLFLFGGGGFYFFGKILKPLMVPHSVKPFPAVGCGYCVNQKPHTFAEKIGVISADPIIIPVGKEQKIFALNYLMRFAPLQE